MIILDSARKHNVSVDDMLKVINDPIVSYIIRSETEKRLLLGFDLKARAIEVITDTGADGQVYVIHANKITKQYEKLLEEVLQ
ncbi:MAG: hypothetical protein LBC71_04915 [Oscillospiraceae bacterium]|nr:hypothetical protein [Oscillospiraceae bacterium]